MTEWMREINEILRPYRFGRDSLMVRLQATKMPYPTVSIVVYDEGEKLFEVPIRRLEGFVNDLQEVLAIIRKVRRETYEERRSEEASSQSRGRGGRRSRRSTQSEDREQEEPDEEASSTQSRSRKSSKSRSRRKAPERD